MRTPRQTVMSSSVTGPIWATAVRSTLPPGARVRRVQVELCLADQVTAHRVLQVSGPVDAYGTADVVLVVGGGVLIDLDKDDLRIVQMGLDPVRVDE